MPRPYDLLHDGLTFGHSDASNAPLRMGMRLAWIAFGGAAFYLVAAIAVPTIVVVLRNRGVEIDDDAAKNLTRLVAFIATPLGGALGMRHARTIEERDPRI